MSQITSDRLKFLVVGCGGREHAIIKALHRSRLNLDIYCFGTHRNPGILPLVSAYATYKSLNVDKIIEFALKMDIKIVIAGGEDCLAAGLSDELEKNGIHCIGCSKSLARLESSKYYCRQLLCKYGMNELNPVYSMWNATDNTKDDETSASTSINLNGDNGNVMASVPQVNKLSVESSYMDMKSKQFSSIEKDLLKFVCDLKGEFVIKCDGLNGGKGVFVSGDHFNTTEEGIAICRNLYNQKKSFLIEEKLNGQEFSLITFCDGSNNYVHAPVVQDYKRLENSNKGPNTGGMGSVSTRNGRMPFLTEKDVQHCRSINEKVCERLMVDNGNEPYIGFLYGSFMKTNNNIIKVIEYNVRLGDPEAINILELLDGDFGEVCVDMISTNLKRSKISFKKEDSKCVYIVPKTYGNNNPNYTHNVNTNKITPDFMKYICNLQSASLIISGIDHLCEDNGKNSPIKHGKIYNNANDSQNQPKAIYLDDLLVEDDSSQENVLSQSQTQLKTNGAAYINNANNINNTSNLRSLVLTGSRAFAYCAVGKNNIDKLNIFLENLKYHEDIIDYFKFRTDIGVGILSNCKINVNANASDVSSTTNTSNNSLYAQAGVNIDNKNEAISSIHSFAKRSHTSNVISNEGGFGGLIRLPKLTRNMRDNNSNYVLINSTDSVGSKSIFVRKWWGKTKGMESLGHDIVNHCVNDILVQSPDVMPWTFLDYYATHSLDPVELRWFVKGASDACKEVGCSLIGGETAEIPGIYKEGCNDLVGAITGVVEEDKLLNPRMTIKPGCIVYALPSDSPHTNGFTLIQSLVAESEKDNDFSYLRHVDSWCKPHKCYTRDIQTLVENDVDILGMCHITGGGYIDNPPRIIDSSLKFNFDYDLIVNNMPMWMKWIYDKVIEYGSDEYEVFKTFNCGYGMLIVIDESQREKIENLQEQLGGAFVGHISEKDINVSSLYEPQNSNVDIDTNTHTHTHTQNSFFSPFVDLL